ncbi:MAG: DUF3299 domain-containing protein [Gemmataceae bacterium]
MNRRLYWAVLLLLLPAPARAGLYYSGETIAELPAQWRGFLVDQRSLRTLALPPAAGLPPSPLQAEYKAALARLEKKADPTADDFADLGALYVRLGQPGKAVDVLRPAQRKHPDHFRLAANLGTAWQLYGDLDQAAESLRNAVRLAPVKLRPAEELQLRLVRQRRKETGKVTTLDDLFGVRFVGEKGVWEPGALAAAQRAKLPADTLAQLQQLALWLPADGRLLWQLGEVANGLDEVRTAAAIFDGCVTEFAMSAPELRERRQALRAVVDKLPPSRTDASSSGHDIHGKQTIRSARPLVRRFDPAGLPEPSAEHPNPLPWGLLALTTLDAKYHPTFPDYLKKVDGKPVMLTGFMQPLGDEIEVNAFLLLEYPVGCWFCETPPPTGLLLVELPAGHTVTIRRGLVKIEAKLKLNAADPEDFLFTLKDAKVGEPD